MRKSKLAFEIPLVSRPRGMSSKSGKAGSRRRKRRKRKGRRKKVSSRRFI